MKHGYCLIVRDYVAEIVEFTTITIIAMPDETKLYFIHTKYGDDYYKEGDLSPTRERFEQECADLNKTLSATKGANEKSIYKVRQ